ncbi:hypothetical protein NKR23_g1295 [Pleurostoma richardsiae]|uniref:F-box domain-containing protein n=1 Tax=Pleurostoma richardsiae TaxID=41990 RepID=A0AA38RS83_9PEZI|nr:hypothetical protein NKR23_g1295 [Pleurostoma richardsiae]
MDTLPPELLAQILLLLPRACLPSLRLTCTAFDAVAAPPLFRPLAPFLLDPRAAEDRLARAAGNPLLRPVSLWDAGTAVPQDMQEEPGFLGALFAGVAGRPWGKKRRAGGMDGEDGGEGEVLTARNFGVLVGREEVTEERVLAAQFMYGMYMWHVMVGRPGEQGGEEDGVSRVERFASWRPGIAVRHELPSSLEGGKL